MSVQEIRSYVNKLSKVLSIATQKKLLIESLQENEDFIINLQKEQLLSGTKADGSDMPEYVEGSKQPSAPGKWTFYESGDFYKGIDAIFENDGFLMDSTDDKTGLMIWMAGEEIFGLNEKSLIKLVSKIKPIMIEKNRALLRKIHS